MQHSDHFYNEGFGWVCRQCAARAGKASEGRPARVFREGEAESKQPQLETRHIARWADPAHSTLTCPDCGITELIEKS